MLFKTDPTDFTVLYLARSSQLILANSYSTGNQWWANVREKSRMAYFVRRVHCVIICLQLKSYLSNSNKANAKFSKPILQKENSQFKVAEIASLNDVGDKTGLKVIYLFPTLPV